MLVAGTTAVPPTSTDRPTDTRMRRARSATVVRKCVVGGRRLDQDRELVAAEARHRVAVTHRRGEPRRHHGQQAVAGGVPEAVVDDLEAVEVEVQDGLAHVTPLAGSG